MESFFQFWETVEESKKKKLYIMRGLSGSGKSTLAKKLGSNGIVLSTDDFFMQDDEYRFDARKLGEYHKANQERAIEAMRKGISPIVIDNTHTQAWEAKPYVQAGLKYGYDVEFAQPDTPWAFNPEELARRNSHGTPKHVIDKMLGRWEPDMTIDKVMGSKNPFE